MGNCCGNIERERGELCTSISTEVITFEEQRNKEEEQKHREEVEKIWNEFDITRNDVLEKEEAFKFLKKHLTKA